MKQTLFTTLALTLTLAASGALAATYKWTDEKGVTHYGDSIPPQYVNQGRAELNKQGNTVNMTEPALSAEELKARQEGAVRQKEQEKRAEEQRRRDIALINTYTTEQEVDLARDRNIQPIDASIKAAQDKLTKLKVRQKELETQLVAIAAKGKTRSAPPEQQEDLEKARAQQIAMQAAIAQLLKDKELVIARFAEDKQRFRELKQGASDAQAATGTGTGKRTLARNTKISPILINECVDRWRDAVRNGKSAYAVASEMQRNGSQEELVLDGRSRSSTGEFTAVRLVCPLTADGQIDAQGVEIKKALSAVGARF